MRKIEITKKDDVFTFTEPLANDELDYKIANGELQEKIFELHESSTKFNELEDHKLNDTEIVEVNRMLSRVNLLKAKQERLSYNYVVKHLVDVKSESLSLESIKLLQVPMSALSDILEAFVESRKAPVDLGK